MEKDEIRKEVIGTVEVCIKPFHALPCATETFTINGKDASSYNFGMGEDIDPENAPDYGCGYRVFKRTEDQAEIEETMNKYSLTREEFDRICRLLEEELFVGECGWCS